MDNNGVRRQRATRRRHNRTGQIGRTAMGSLSRSDEEANDSWPSINHLEVAACVCYLSNSVQLWCSDGTHAAHKKSRTCPHTYMRACMPLRPTPPPHAAAAVAYYLRVPLAASSCLVYICATWSESSVNNHQQQQQQQQLRRGGPLRIRPQPAQP
eukprot:GHVU01116351.1.p1 GENE.GHVU01116351.1~~GHVU01116351.1.p1  ORF type:complete len:155 (+),score=21.06 GHVU01116351.1:136-600(+)